MNNLRFRAWDGKEMHQPVCINHEGKAIKYGYRATDWVEDANAGIPMQYTGYKQNDVEWFEGDIVSFKCGEQGEGKQLYDYVGKIVFNRGCFFIDIANCFRNSFELHEINGNNEYMWHSTGYYVAKDFKIIGNIHQHPELLTAVNH